MNLVLSKNLFMSQHLKFLDHQRKSISENFQFFFPSTPYATSKLSAELLIKNYNKNYVKKGIITRFSNFYGPGQPNYRLIPKIANFN